MACLTEHEGHALSLYRPSSFLWERDNFLWCLDLGVGNASFKAAAQAPCQRVVRLLQGTSRVSGPKEPIAEAFVDDWLEHSFGSDEHLYELFADLGRLMAEAALMSDLSADERDALAQTLEDWQARLEEYGVDEGFHVAIRALQTACDDPVLAAVMAGKDKAWPPSGRGNWLDDQLTAVRLRVLEACGRTQEYLNLARAARAHTSYAVMLVKLERMPEAIEYARKSFETPDEALALATALREAAAHDDALTIAEAGLGLAGDDDDEAGGAVIPLAHWLRDYAGGIGKSALALKAARTAFEHSLSLEDFGAVKPWAGDAWDAIRKDLLAHLARAPHPTTGLASTYPKA